MMGVRVYGAIDIIEELWTSGQFDAVISTIVKDNDERREIFEAVTAKGIPFTNIIDTTANIRSNVRMGKGNLIVSGCYLAPSLTMGDNNFLAAYTAIEHHSVVGSHCTFGPRFTASGKVTIGDNCKFGTGIFVEPFVKIGNNTTIASGAIITGHIPENSLVKTESRLHIKSKLK
jgi:acetyltransferase-like isoleucine patch superfamily enzyme